MPARLRNCHRKNSEPSSPECRGKLLRDKETAFVGAHIIRMSFLDISFDRESRDHHLSVFPSFFTFFADSTKEPPRRGSRGYAERGRLYDRQPPRQHTYRQRPATQREGNGTQRHCHGIALAPFHSSPQTKNLRLIVHHESRKVQSVCLHSAEKDEHFRQKTRNNETACLRSSIILFLLLSSVIFKLASQQNRWMYCPFPISPQIPRGPFLLHA